MGRYVRKNKFSHMNFQSQELGLLISQAYPNLGVAHNGVIACNCCGKGILKIKCPWTSREKLISEYVTQPGSSLITTIVIKSALKIDTLYVANSTSTVCYK